MNITFLIGNGFDVGLGLKSKFTEFFPEYVKNSTNKDANIKMLSEKIGPNYKTWADFEIQMGKYTGDFDPKDSKIILEQFRDFETDFMEYLKREEGHLTFENADAISKQMISALQNFYSTDVLSNGSTDAIKQALYDRRNEARVYNFISFNYTSALDNCLGTIRDGVVQKRSYGSTLLTDKINKIVHIHGERSASPIMGVNDSTQIANKVLATDKRFTRYLIKPVLNSAHRTNHDKEASDLISSSHIVCIYGMALGATDMDWWHKILVWLNKSPDRQLVIFDYDPQFSTSSQFDWIDKEDSILDKLALYRKGTSIDVENLRPRIHIAVHKNIFEMNLRRKTENRFDIISEVGSHSDFASQSIDYFDENHNEIVELARSMSKG